MLKSYAPFPVGGNLGRLGSPPAFPVRKQKSTVFSIPVCRGQPSVHYNSPDEYANAFQQMIDAREKWREQIRQQEITNCDQL